MEGWARSKHSGMVRTTLHCVYSLGDCHMTYARPYVNRMLKRRPLGKEFFIIRDLILRHRTPLAAILTWRKRPIPWDGPWWIMYANRIWQELNLQSRNWPPEVIRNRKLCAEEATKRTEVLLTQLDKSEESQRDLSAPNHTFSGLVLQIKAIPY